MKSRTVALLRERPGERNDRRVLDPYPVPVKFGILPTHRIRQFGAPFASLFGDDADAVDPVAKPMGDYRVTGLVVGNRLFFMPLLLLTVRYHPLCPFFCPSFL